MIFKAKQDEPLLFETFGEYNADGYAIRKMVDKVNELQFQLDAGQITQGEWESEMKLLYNTVAQLESKYGCAVDL